MSYCPYCENPILANEDSVVVPRINAGMRNVRIHADCARRFRKTVKVGKAQSGAKLKDITYGLEVVMAHASTAFRTNVDTHTKLAGDTDDIYHRFVVKYPLVDKLNGISRLFSDVGFFAACDRNGINYEIAEVVFTMTRKNGERRCIPYSEGEDFTTLEDIGDCIRGGEFAACDDWGFPEWSALMTGTRKKK